MRFLSCLILVLSAASSLSGQDLQQIADNLNVKAPAAGSKRLVIPKVKGVDIRLLGADYEQIIDSKGRLITPLCDTPVRVSFEVSKDGKSAISRDYEIVIKGSYNDTGKANPKPQIIPELLNWKGGKGEFELPREIKVYGKEAFIPEFIRELNSLLPEGHTASLCNSAKGATFMFNRYKGVDDERYGLGIAEGKVSISSPGQTGLYWGSRTLLQMLAQNPRALPIGLAWDAPRYKLRGLVLDVGRLPVPLDYLKNVIRLMSWFKMNDLQLHLNDNYIFHEHYVKQGEEPFRKSYSAFRLESSVKGQDGTMLTAQDLFYTRSQFRELVEFARQRGVQIVPEIDTPGHALSFTRVRPDLIYQGPMRHPDRRCEMLDAGNPESLRFACKVWDEFLLGSKPAFGNCQVVHAGADEFFGEPEDYRRFADGLLRHIQERRHTPRIWGSLKAKKGSTPVRSQGVQMNMWSRDWATAWESVRQGYDIINTHDAALYIVPFARYYRADKNQKGLYENWLPNLIGPDLLPAGHPQLLGASFAVWNDEIDLLHNGYGAVDFWTTISDMVNVLSGKMWGQPSVSRSFDEHKALAARLGSIPGCNPLHQSAGHFSLEPGLTPIRLGKGSRGPAYHLTMELMMPESPVPGEEQILLESDQGQLLAAGKDGRITLRRSDSLEFAYNARLPIGRKVTLELIGRMGATQLIIDGVSAGEPENVRFPHRQDGRMNTFILPLENLGSSFSGRIYRIELKHPYSSDIRF